MYKPIVSRISSRFLQCSRTFRWRSSRSISSSSRRLLPRFLTPKEEQELYQSITSSFREKLASNTAKTQDFYSSIIEQSLFAVPRSNPPSSSKVQNICSRIDAAVTAKRPQELKPLKAELDRSNAPVKYYNYLIRAYISLKDVKGAEYVLKHLPIGILPSARTFTLLMQEYLTTDLDRAYEYLRQMQNMSCKLHRSFDYIVIMRLHIRRDDPLAVDFAWKDMLQHKEAVKPTMQLYTTYLGYLGSKKKYEKATEVVHDLVAYSRTNDGVQKSISPVQCKTLTSIANQLATNGQPQSASMLVGFLSSSTVISTTTKSGLPEGLMPSTISLPSDIYTNIIKGYMKLEKYSPIIDFYKEVAAKKDVHLEAEALCTIEEARKCLMNMQTKQRKDHGKLYIANLAPV